MEAFNLLVVDADPCHDWARAFRNAGVRGLKVFQTSWSKISLQTCTWNTCVVDIEASDPDQCIPFRGMDRARRNVNVHFALIRNYPRLLHGEEYVNIVRGMHFAGVRAVNSMWSLLQASDRAVLYAALNDVKRRVGRDVFPFIDASFYENLSHKTTQYAGTYPCVVKIASSCAGHGKMLIRSKGQMDDLKGVLELHKDFYTVEPFCESKYDIRLQWLDGHMRAYKRIETKDGAWKRNTAQAQAKCEDVPLTPAYVRMMKEVSVLFGGLDIFTIDLLRLKDGSDVILEINDAGSGLWESRYGWHSSAPGHGGIGVDNERIRDLVIRRILDADPALRMGASAAKEEAPDMIGAKERRRGLATGLLASIRKERP